MEHLEVTLTAAFYTCLGLIDLYRYKKKGSEETEGTDKIFIYFLLLGVPIFLMGIFYWIMQPKSDLRWTVTFVASIVITLAVFWLGRRRKKGAS